MTVRKIKVKWRESEEYYEIDFSSPPKIIETHECWLEKGIDVWVNYIAELNFQHKPDKSIILEISYSPENNQHLKDINVRWGKAEILIKHGKNSGKATWNDREGKECSGILTWKFENEEISDIRERKLISAINRRQSQFRNKLVKRDKCCVITQESTIGVLEAAHVLPVKSGGREVVENGILLRADIHRMFDAGLLSISVDGCIYIDEKASKYYKNKFHGKRIASETLMRIKKSLAKRNEICA